MYAYMYMICLCVYVIYTNLYALFPIVRSQTFTRKIISSIPSQHLSIRKYPHFPPLPFHPSPPLCFQRSFTPPPSPARRRSRHRQTESASSSRGPSPPALSEQSSLDPAHAYAHTPPRSASPTPFTISNPLSTFSSRLQLQTRGGEREGGGDGRAVHGRVGAREGRAGNRLEDVSDAVTPREIEGEEEGDRGSLSGRSSIDEGRGPIGRLRGHTIGGEEGRKGVGEGTGEGGRMRSKSEEVRGVLGFRGLSMRRIGDGKTDERAWGLRDMWGGMRREGSEEKLRQVGRDGGGSSMGRLQRWVLDNCLCVCSCLCASVYVYVCLYI